MTPLHQILKKHENIDEEPKISVQLMHSHEHAGVRDKTKALPQHCTISSRETQTMVTRVPCKITLYKAGLASINKPQRTHAGTLVCTYTPRPNSRPAKHTRWLSTDGHDTSQQEGDMARLKLYTTLSAARNNSAPASVCCVALLLRT